MADRTDTEYEVEDTILGPWQESTGWFAMLVVHDLRISRYHTTAYKSIHTLHAGTKRGIQDQIAVMIDNPQFRIIGD